MVHKIGIVFHSTYGHTYKCAQAVAEGIRSAGAEPLLFQVPEVLDESTRQRAGASAAAREWAYVPVATAESIAVVDGLILGCPTRFGGMSSEMRSFLDRTSKQWLLASLAGKPGATFVSTGTQNGGCETTCIDMETWMLHHGMLFVGIPYTESNLLVGDQIHGASPMGAGTISGNDGRRLPTDTELALCRSQGARVARLAIKLADTPAQPGTFVPAPAPAATRPSSSLVATTPAPAVATPQAAPEALAAAPVVADEVAASRPVVSSPMPEPAAAAASPAVADP